MEETSKAGYLIGNNRFKQIGEDFLVTTNHGSWDFLTKKEFAELTNDSLEEGSDFFKRLEEKGIILTEKNKEKVKNLLKKRNNFLENGTDLHIVIPTLRCNQKCVYCHASSKPIDSPGYDMDENTAKAVVDFIFQSPSKTLIIEFQGGEPLLRFDIVKYIIEYTTKLNEKFKKKVFFTVVTNFSLLSKDKLDYLVEKNVSICTSLDGPSNLHDKNRPFTTGVGSHSLVEEAIKNLGEEYKKKEVTWRKINALITITKDSLPLWKEIIDEYIRLNLDEIHLRFLNNLGDARQSWKDIAYTPEEFVTFWKKSIDYILQLNKKGVRFMDRSALILLAKILKEVDPNFLDIRSPCGAAIGQLAYTPQGDIFSCDEARMVAEDLFKLGNVKTDNYKKVISSIPTISLICASTNDCQICDYCAYKPYCGICPVCNFVEQGSIIANIPKTARCKIYKEQFTYIFSLLKDPENKKIFLSWMEKNKPKNEKRE
jgi:His-Xaa-Ser system radical SAM maturase HxsB